MGQIQAAQDLELLKEWYLRDENAVPALYFLQPLNDRNRKEFWSSAQGKLHEILRQATARLLMKGTMSTQERVKYAYSITEQEIHRGLFHAEGAENHVLAVLRDIEDIEEHLSDPEAKKYYPLVLGEYVHQALLND